MNRGQALDFEVERTIMEGFTGNENWWEINIDHPVSQAPAKHHFPKRAPLPGSCFVLWRYADRLTCY